MNARETTRYRALVTRRARHVPVAYLTGQKEFYGHSIAVSPSVLIPRPETELLVEQALEFIRSHPSVTRVIDLGTGSGAVAIALASAVRRIRVEAIEIDPRALAVARRNLRAHGLLSRVTLRRGDLLASVRKAHCIVANLPYLSLARRRRLPPDVRHEPTRALNGGRDGLDLIRRAIAQAPNVLRRPGCLLVECDPAQARSVLALARKAFPYGTAEVLRDLTGRPRVVRVMVE